MRLAVTEKNVQQQQKYRQREEQEEETLLGKVGLDGKKNEEVDIKAGKSTYWQTKWSCGFWVVNQVRHSHRTRKHAHNIFVGSGLHTQTRMHKQKFHTAENFPDKKKPRSWKSKRK